jgi:hypothetical protein
MKKQIVTAISAIGMTDSTRRVAYLIIGVATYAIRRRFVLRQPKQSWGGVAP